VKFKYEDQIEQLTRHARDEAKQLHDTIQALRDELEVLKKNNA